MKFATTVLQRRASLLAIAVCGLVAACGKNAATSDATATAQQFPGYHQVGQTGDAAQLWFNPDDIQRVASGYVVHALTGC